MQNDYYHLKENKNAETKYRTDSAAAGAARLLCGVSAVRISTQVCGATEELQGDTRLLWHDGSHHATRLKGESEQPRHEPPVAPTL